MPGVDTAIIVFEVLDKVKWLPCLVNVVFTIPRSFTTSDAVNWLLPFKNDGILTWTFLVANKPWTLNPRSAVMLSPALNRCLPIRSDLSQICQSLVEPP